MARQRKNEFGRRRDTPARRRNAFGHGGNPQAQAVGILENPRPARSEGIRGTRKKIPSRPERENRILPVAASGAILMDKRNSVAKARTPKNAAPNILRDRRKNVREKEAAPMTPEGKLPGIRRNPKPGPECSPAKISMCNDFLRHKR